MATALLGTGATVGYPARGEGTEATTTSSGCLDDRLATANGYDGVTERHGPDDDPSITVGEHLGAGHGTATCGPAGIRVPPGTTLTWRWSGHGDPSNVVALDGAFDSGDPTVDEGSTFEHTFAETAVHRDACAPPHSRGAKGAIVGE